MLKSTKQKYTNFNLNKADALCDITPTNEQVQNCFPDLKMLLEDVSNRVMYELK